MKPYIGITGFKSLHEVKSISRAADLLGLGNNKEYALMMGFLTSDNRLRELTKESHRSPAFADLPELLSAVPDSMFPVIHHHTDHPEQLGDQLSTIFNVLYGENLCRAVQINIDWPDTDILKQTKERFPDLDIVLQLPQNALNVPVDGLVSKASEYAGLVSYILIDPSAGAGINYDSSKAVNVLNRLNDAIPSTINGVAGGLCAKNVFDQTTDIVSGYANKFFIDAENKLRSDDWLSLDIGKCMHYLSEAKLALER